jgi:hypothetical protein
MERELFAEVVNELIQRRGFVPPLSGSMFGVRLTREDGQLKSELVCQYVEVQFALPMNVMVVDDANHVARVLVPLSGERTVTVPSGPSLR